MPPRFTLLVLLIVATISLFYKPTSCTDYDFPDYSYHPCVRDCEIDAAPRRCHYDWLLENYYVLSKACWNCPNNQSDCFRPHCIPANGIKRAVKTANRKIPGPEIQVCVGDTIEVTVDNRMDTLEGTSIHWHGVLQRQSPHMDGIAMVTQCPIHAMSKFTYRFTAQNAGTHFWHAHAGFQRSDGLFGALIVRNPPALEPSYLLYDLDLPEHVIILTDWVDETGSEWFAAVSHDGKSPIDVYLLINGLGPDKSEQQPETPRATFKVKANQKYRFRVIHSGSFHCPVQVSIDSHTMMVIASDGNTVEPMVVDSFDIQAGERFDFVLFADKTSPLKKYWIRVGGLSVCVFNQIFQTAILEYEGSPDELPDGNLTYADSFKHGTNLNAYDTYDTSTELAITRMQSSSPDDDTLTSEPDRKIYMAMDFNYKNNPRTNHPTYYSIEKVPSQYQRTTPQINHISLRLPSSPPLSQLEDIPESEYCNADTVQKPCNREYCECVHRYQFELGDLVELVLIDEGVAFDSFHPMHLHGFHFRVIGTGKINRTTSEDEIKAMDQKGELQRLTTKAPLKDTVAVPDGGYTIIRFKADSPGVWFFHCHKQQHNSQGMGVLFQVGTASQMPKPPRNFPRCGSWHFHGYDEEDDDDTDDDDDNDQGSDEDSSNDVRCVINLNTNNSGEIRFSLYLTTACLLLLMFVDAMKNNFN